MSTVWVVEQKTYDCYERTDVLAVASSLEKAEEKVKDYKYDRDTLPIVVLPQEKGFHDILASGERPHIVFYEIELL
jgi:hypothetical protein